MQTLIEVKAIGLDLKDHHVKQAIDYAANQGVDWVLLTNGTQWRVYHVIFAKPIGQELIVDIDFCALSPRSANDLETLFLWCKEGWQRSVLGEYRDQRQALSRFSVAAVLQSDAVISVIRRELRRLSPDIRIEADEVGAVLVNEVLKRDVLEGDQAADAKKKLARCAQKRLRDAKAEVPVTKSMVAGKPMAVAQN